MHTEGERDAQMKNPAKCLFSMFRMITSRPKIITATIKSFQRTELIGIKIKYKCYELHF